MKQLDQLLKLDGKSAIVTGGAMGIGAGITYRLAEAGAKVMIVDLNEAVAQKTSDDLVAKGWNCKFMKADVSSEEDVKNVISTCVEEFDSVDILINNAGIYPPSPVAQMTEEEFEKVMHVNLRSVFLATKYASKVMKTRGGGKIINITSIDALHPSMVGLAHYDASKHGVWGFTKNSALELAQYNIQVNAIAPGGIMTPGVEALSGGTNSTSSDSTQRFIDKIPMHRMGTPDEIGTAVLFLASDMASYMTGSQIVVDGGALLT